MERELQCYQMIEKHFEIKHLEAERVDVLRGSKVMVIGFSSVEHCHVAHGDCGDQLWGYVHYPEERKRSTEQFP